MYLFGSIFTVLKIQLSSLFPQKQVYSAPMDIQLDICDVKSGRCIARRFCIAYGKVSRLLLCFGTIPIPSFLS